MPDPTKTLDFQAYFAIGSAIVLPVNRQICPFTPNGVYVNNRSAKSIQVGPTVQGPFTPIGSNQIATLPWTYGPSLYIREIGSTAVLSGDFLDVHFLSVSGPSGIGAPSLVAGTASGWGPSGPANSLVNVNPGDAFDYGQVQQLINLLTGVMTGQVVTIANVLTVANQVNSTGASAGFAFDDRDGIGGDVFGWSANAGLARLFSSVAAGFVLTVDESGNMILTGTTTCTSLIAGSISNNNVGMYAGAAAPSPFLGSDGDYYFRSNNAATPSIYKHVGGGWVVIV